MAYRDPAQQQAYQRRWVAAKRQRARQPQPLSLAAWAAQVQALQAACDATQQMLQQLTPALRREGSASGGLSAVSEVAGLVVQSKARLKQIAATLAELKSCQRRLAAIVRERQP